MAGETTHASSRLRYMRHRSSARCPCLMINKTGQERLMARRSPDNRAPTRRYLKPIFGCLRRNRRGVFAAAVTRYLKPVYAAEPADIEDFARRQILGA